MKNHHHIHDHSCICWRPKAQNLLQNPMCSDISAAIMSEAQSMQLCILKARPGEGRCTGTSKDAAFCCGSGLGWRPEAFQSAFGRPLSKLASAAAGALTAFRCLGAKGKVALQLLLQLAGQKSKPSSHAAGLHGGGVLLPDSCYRPMSHAGGADRPSCFEGRSDEPACGETARSARAATRLPVMYSTGVSCLSAPW